MLKSGDAAADFVLPDTTGKDLRLSSFSGRAIVLAFFPSSRNPFCVLEAQRFRQHQHAIAEAGGALLGVSLDGHETNDQMRSRFDLQFPWVSDAEGHVHDLYEAWRTTLLGRSPLAVRRCTYLIDADGIIQKSYRAVNPLAHPRQVVRDLRRLQAQRSWGQAAADGNGKDPDDSRERRKGKARARRDSAEDE